MNRCLLLETSFLKIIYFYKMIIEPFEKYLQIFFKGIYYVSVCCTSSVRSCTLSFVCSFPCFNQMKKIAQLNVKSNRFQNGTLRNCFK